MTRFTVEIVVRDREKNYEVIRQEPIDASGWVLPDEQEDMILYVKQLFEREEKACLDAITAEETW